MARKERKQPNDEELRKDSHHVLYEIEQLSGAVARLSDQRRSGEQVPEVDENALLESIAVHARALIEFAYADPDTARSDDVIAADFLPDWPQIRPPESKFLRQMKVQADKQIMHITRERTIAEDVRQWKYGRVHTELQLILADFIRQVPDDKVIPRFPKAARAAFPVAKLSKKEAEDTALLEIGKTSAIYGATHAAPDLKFTDD